MSHGNKTVKRKCINNDSLFSWKSFFLVVAYHLLFLAAALICKYSGLNDLERTIPFVYAIPASITIGYYLVALLIKRPRRRNPSKKKSLQLFEENIHCRATASLEAIVWVFSFYLVILLWGVFL